MLALLTPIVPACQPLNTSQDTARPMVTPISLNLQSKLLGVGQSLVAAGESMGGENGAYSIDGLIGFVPHLIRPEKGAAPHCR